MDAGALHAAEPAQGTTQTIKCCSTVYNYNPKFDVLRALMKVSTSAVSIEQFTIGFADVKPDRGVLYMAWDRTIGSIDFTVRK